LQLKGDSVGSHGVLFDLIVFQNDLLRVGSVIGVTMAERGVPE
jgi:hypothetical protein